MEFKPFEDKEEVERLQKERTDLVLSLENFNIPEDEKRFILRKINNITERLLHKARYAKNAKDIK